MAQSSETSELELYERMLFIRMVEEMIAERYGQPGEPQEMRCPVHLSIGQEAVAVGVCAAMEKCDVLFSTHRNHAHYLAKGGDLKAMLAEIYGKGAGCIGGRGGSMHLMDKSVGMMASIPIVASSIPIAVGAALSLSLDGAKRISSVIFGDAALEEGVWHESANFAALRNLPVLFVCENNLSSVYTPLHERQIDATLGRFAAAHDIDIVTADGNDVDAVYGAARQAVDQMRQRPRPVFLLCDTYRFREHCGPNFDDHLGYRPAEEVAQWSERDPLTIAAARLRENGALSDDWLAKTRDRLKSEIENAFEFARSQSLPAPADAARYVYA